MAARNRVKGGRAWIDEHVNDPYVQRARSEGYRSRAAFKLQELDRRDRIFRPGQRVVDLGAAPGSWSQVAVERIGERGRVIAVDLLEFGTLAGVDQVIGDFTTDETLARIHALLEGAPVDVVLSDMAPNLSGIASVDQARATLLAELAFDFAREQLKPSGMFVVKVFQGAGFPELLVAMRRHFATVHSRKPDASRDRSAEMYLVATGRRA